MRGCGCGCGRGCAGAQAAGAQAAGATLFLTDVTAFAAGLRRLAMKPNDMAAMPPTAKTTAYVVFGYFRARDLILLIMARVEKRRLLEGLHHTAAAARPATDEMQPNAAKRREMQANAARR